MCKNKIKRAARKVKRDLKGDVNIIGIIEYLKLLGYSTVFFNDIYGDSEVKRYNLQDKVEEVKAFTYSKTANIVFIDKNQHAQDKFYLILHELGHIALKHLGDGNLHMRDKILIDIEADAFAYEMLN